MRKAFSVIHAAILVTLVALPAFAVDCDLNGVQDSSQISASPGLDANLNGLLDRCEISAGGYSISSIIDVPLFSYGAPDIYLTPTHIADFNGDGHPDLWGTRSSLGMAGESAAAFVYINNGDNTFAAPEIVVFSGFPNTSNTWVLDAKSGDFDEDGDQDIFVVLKGNVVNGPPAEGVDFNVLRNNGSGHLVSTVTNIKQLLPAYQLGSQKPIRFLQQSYARPGSADLALLYEGRLYALYRTSDVDYVVFDMGAAAGAENLISLRQSFPSTAAAFSPSDEFGLIQGQGDGSAVRRNSFSDTVKGYQAAVVEEFYVIAQRARVSATPTGRSAFAVSNINGMPEGAIRSRVANVRELSLADFDGDARQDLLVLGNDNAEVLFNLGTGRFGRTLTLFRPGDLALSPSAAADFNADGKADLLYSYASNAAKAAIVINGSSAFSEPLTPDADVTGVPDALERAEVLDFDGDRRSDPTLVRSQGASLVWYSQPAASLGILDNSPAGVLFGSASDTPLAGDFDGDGVTNPGVVSPINGALVWRYLRVDQSSADIIFGINGDTPLTGYFDSDRMLDRAVARRTRRELVWYIFSSASQTITAVRFGKPSDRPFTGDLNGDGIEELIVARQSRRNIVWYGLGLNGQTYGPQIWGVSSDTLLPPADINGDGRVNFLIVRRLGEALWAFSLESPATPLLIGEAGDAVLTSSFSGIRQAEFLNLDNVRRTSWGEMHIRQESGAITTVVFGLVGDRILGADGKVAPLLSGPGNLSCSAMVTSYDGPGGFAWAPTGGGRGGAFPVFSVPAAYTALISSVEVYSRAGVKVDRMSRISRTANYASRSLTAAQLNNVGPYLQGPIVQMRLRNRSNICASIAQADFAQD